MKKLFIVFLLTSLSIVGYGQRNNQVDKEKLEAARVAFITNRLSLSPDQAAKFWPLYNEYQEKRNAMTREMRQISKKGEEEITNAEAEELIEKRFKLQENLLVAEKNFTRKIASNLSAIHALKLEEINRDFTRHIYRMHRKQRESKSESSNN
ncbi:Spy/CpxP family protein refolding chaperone [Cyclobacterium marinum]|uniref:Sensor of ECF-type sigma factor n=1 Tax=Cyclobacterium marinum (strain ATCC 25205 / DSM 745 / LMG 13164 / NCIMB 1802) TaxID=880070 RepID=G0IXQ9_CYCMS|nr:Spy/CpxP family protein refolding chaperone [Cyclobacterium marinum]AEL28056.1 hypothetical protein Cycma_4354 [Cyclobacterium marinum DSM 745]MBI0397827.1 hypothetical protein [Cyclobacterium marinum]